MSFLGVFLVPGPFQGLGMSRVWCVQEGLSMSGDWAYPGGGYLPNTPHPLSSYPHPILVRLGTHLILGPGVDTDTDAPYECPRVFLPKTNTSIYAGVSADAWCGTHLNVPLMFTLNSANSVTQNIIL